MKKILIKNQSSKYTYFIVVITWKILLPTFYGSEAHLNIFRQIFVEFSNTYKWHVLQITWFVSNKHL